MISVIYWRNGRRYDWLTCRSKQHLHRVLAALAPIDRVEITWN